MKKTLLTVLLSIGFLSAISAQNLKISELMVSPPGDDSPREFIELRGDAGATIAIGTYLVQIEGDGGNNPGDIESDSGNQGGIIDLSGLVLGSNGYLVILTAGHPYFVDANATELTGLTDGTLEDQSHTFLLINAPAKPSSNDDIDDNDDGEPNGTVYDSWTILDGISILDNDDIGGDKEFGYADVIFCRCVSSDKGVDVLVPSSATIAYTGSQQFDYFARAGESTGNTLTNDAATSDWFGGDLSSVVDLTTENWKLSTSSGKSYPEAFGGTEIDNIGKVNPTAATASVDNIFASNFTIYPNPVSNVLKMNTTLEIDNIEVYNVIGLRVLATSSLSNNTLDVSILSKGVYLMKISSGSSVTSKKFVKKL
jgi:hypothetical protein